MELGDNAKKELLLKKLAELRKEILALQNQKQDLSIDKKTVLQLDKDIKRITLEMNKIEKELKTIEKQLKPKESEIPTSKQQKDEVVSKLKEKSKLLKGISYNIQESRSYIPQGFAGIIYFKDMDESLKKHYKFLATSGLSPCVGFVMYAENQGNALLVHFDDELNITDKNAKLRHGGDYDRILEISQKYYNFYVENLFKMLGNPKDIKVTVISSTTDGSKSLSEIIKIATRLIGVTNFIENEDKLDTESCLLSLNDGKIERYEETLDIPTEAHKNMIKKENFEKKRTIEEILNLPPKNFSLFRLKNNNVIQQKTNELLEMDGIHIKSKSIIKESTIFEEKKYIETTQNEILNEKEVSKVYWYEDSEMRRILELQIAQHNNQTSNGQPAYLLGPLDNISPYGLMETLEIHNRQSGVVLIPFNLGQLHWVGLVLEYNINGDLVKADYYDSQRNDPPVFLNEELFAMSRNSDTITQFNSLKNSPTLIRQTNGNDCGPCTIENLLASIGYRETEDTRAIDRRLRHLQLLEVADDVNFYASFYERQRLNQSSFAVFRKNNMLQSSKKALEKSEQFSISEYSELLSLALKIFILPEDIQKKLKTALSPVEEHSSQLDQIRSVLNDYINNENVLPIIHQFFHLKKDIISLEDAPLKLDYNQILPLSILLSLSRDQIEEDAKEISLLYKSKSSKPQSLYLKKNYEKLEESEGLLSMFKGLFLKHPNIFPDTNTKDDLIKKYELKDSSQQELERCLRKASLNNQINDVETLINKFKVNINAQDNKQGKTALHWAVIKNHFECVENLLSNGADPNVQDFENKTPAEYTSNEKTLDLLKSNMIKSKNI